jgi:hypothetical protein
MLGYEKNENVPSKALPRLGSGDMPNLLHGQSLPEMLDF